jgi:hypothetical protein
MLGEVYFKAKTEGFRDIDGEKSWRTNLILICERTIFVLLKLERVVSFSMKWKWIVRK